VSSKGSYPESCKYSNTNICRPTYKLLTILLFIGGDKLTKIDAKEFARDRL